MRITVIATDAEHRKIKDAAGDVPLSRFILRTVLNNLGGMAERGDALALNTSGPKVRAGSSPAPATKSFEGENEGSDHQDAVGIPDVRVAGRRAAAAAPAEQDSSARPERTYSERFKKTMKPAKKFKKPPMCQHGFYEGCCPKGC